jgi:hypothetical protein
MMEWEPRLVEEAVLAALPGRREATDFRRERDRLYEIRDPEARETAFRDLHGTWFERLDLGRPLLRAVEEQASIAAATCVCRVASARSRKEEGAELFVGPVAAGESPRARRWVVIRLRPEAFGAPDHLLRFLRHELFHIADMLDPRFAYEPGLPPAPAGPAHEALQRERYRVLWDAAIDGRLARLGRAPASVRADRLEEFRRTFPMLDPHTDEAFRRFFDGHGHTHALFVAVATGPDGLADHGMSGPRPQTSGPRVGERCPICRFPTHAFEADPERLPPDVVARIRADFPVWDAAQGLCRQCADLYRTRAGAPR